MKKLLLLLAMVAVCTGSVSNAQSDKKMTRKEREAAWRAARLKKKAEERAREEQRDSIDFMQAIEALRSGSWALEANNVTYDNGVTNFVTESTNFVSADNGTVTVQTALNNKSRGHPSRRCMPGPLVPRHG